jgi:ribonuclease P protein component
VKRRFRLASSSDFKRVRRFGKSYAHPFVVLVTYPNQLEKSRFGITASRSLGSAVNRNRAKRRIRAIIQPFTARVIPGWDVVLIARQPLITACFQEAHMAVTTLFVRAGLLLTGNDSAQSSSSDSG